ncbi:MAG: ADP-ribosylglycohydrolase family protein, partial [Planctomycetota bacterium]
MPTINKIFFTFSITIITLTSACRGPELRISLTEYQDKVYASWLGQCIGNMYGLAHEWAYRDQPRTQPITGWDKKILERIHKTNGAFSDDDTDIEYVDLFCMEKYGPEPTYENLAEFWKLCINRYIWVANEEARKLMDQGYLPPLTGRQGLNPDCFQIDPQLVCEIWAVTAPGMLQYAAAKADWAAKVTNDDYGTHPTIWYNTMYAAAFFQKDVEKLCQIGYDHLPQNSIFRTAIDDVRKWKKQHGQDWVAVRKKIKLKYLLGQGLPDNIAKSQVSALLNGTLGVLALLYGQGDFTNTMNHACMAGYDADNQCATLAGLVAIIHGSKSIPRRFTHLNDKWTQPLNDFYKNYTRDHLPDGKITEMAKRTAKLGQDLILTQGGKIQGSGKNAALVINPQARFIPPLEVRLFPIHLKLNKEVMVRPEIIGSHPNARPMIIIAGSLPAGMHTQHQDGLPIITGTPTKTGQYQIT